MAGDSGGMGRGRSTTCNASVAASRRASLPGSVRAMSLSAVIMAAARKWGTRSATRRVRPRADKARVHGARAHAGDGDGDVAQRQVAIQVQGGGVGMAGAQHAGQPVFVQRTPVQAGGQRVEHAHGQVHGAVGDPADVVAGGLGNVQVQARRQPREPRHQSRHDQQRQVVVRGKGVAARGSGRIEGRRRNDGAGGFQQAADGAGQLLAPGREFQPVLAARHQAVVEHGPQPAQGAAGGGLAQPETQAGARDAALLCQRVEELQQVQVDGIQIHFMHVHYAFHAMDAW